MDCLVTVVLVVVWDRYHWLDKIGLFVSPTFRISGKGGKAMGKFFPLMTARHTARI